MPARSDPSSLRRGILARRIRLLVAATITYNVAEAAIALTEGARVSSSALFGFGLDSVIEVSSAAAVAWQFAARDPETREKAALRFIAFSFFALAAYITVDAVLSLLGLGEARPSPIGVALASASLVIMPALSLAQRRAGREPGSHPRSRLQTRRCSSRTCRPPCWWPAPQRPAGWWSADSVAALVIAAIAVREGIIAWRGDPCC